MPALPARLSRAALLCAGFAALFLTTAASATAAAGWSAPLRPLTVTRPFEPPPNPYAAGHRGVDLAGAAGQAVLAAAVGQISFAGQLAGRGVMVVVHGSLRTTYEPVTAKLGRGVHVERGEQIGTLEPGHPGCPVSACLHWGLLRGDRYLDPMTMLEPAQIRLLPVTAGSGGATVTNPAQASMVRATAATAPHPAVPSPLAWSAAALAGGGVIVALRRR